MRAVLIAGVLLLAAPASASAGVLLYGDSLAVGTQPYLAATMPDQRVRFDVTVSRHADEGPRDLDRRRRLPKTLMISLGTNDDPNNVAGFKSAVRATMRLAGRDRCVVWADVLRPAVGGTTYGGYNRALKRQAKRRPNLVMLRWRRMVRRHPEWLAGDGVHVSAQGYEARARAYARGARKCA